MVGVGTVAAEHDGGHGTLVNVLGAVAAGESGRTAADEGSIDGRSVTNGSFRATRVTGTGIVHLTQQSRLSSRTDADKGGCSIHTRGSLKTSGPGTVVDVAFAVISGPSVDTDTGEGADRVDAGRSVATDARLFRALVHVLLTEGTSQSGATDTRVLVWLSRIVSGDTSGPVAAHVAVGDAGVRGQSWSIMTVFA